MCTFAKPCTTSTGCCKGLKACLLLCLCLGVLRPVCSALVASFLREFWDSNVTSAEAAAMTPLETKAALKEQLLTSAPRMVATASKEVLKVGVSVTPTLQPYTLWSHMWE